MTLESVLVQKRDAVLGKWWGLIMDTYPADTARFLKQERDRFVNPVGYSLRTGIGAIYDGLCRGESAARLAESLREIIRIRSVQDLPPSQAVAFVFLLKKAVLGELGREPEDWSRFEARIDELALQSFDIYTAWREKVCDIRINEMKVEKERVLRLLQETK